MNRIVVGEYGRIERASLGLVVCHRLQKFDEQQARKSGDTVFDWSLTRWIRAKSYVGVIQVPGLVVEILPKVDASAGDEAQGHFELAQQNLLYMLSVTQKVPIHRRGLASQSTKRLPFLEALIAIYLDRLLTELRRGRHHTYVGRESNLAYLRGKLLIGDHLRKNIAHRNRLYVGYEEFTDDTVLNQILKAATRRLLAISTSPRNQQYVREALIELADVEDRDVRVSEFEHLAFDRGNQRYSDIVDFAKLILTQLCPSPMYGSTPTFSLLFPMEQLFEEFIGRMLLRHAAEIGLQRRNIHLHAAGQKRWLLREEGRGGRFRLIPDVVVADGGGRTRLVLDTKWKRLVPDEQDPRNGTTQADMYQLYAYANRYECPDSVLVYPAVAGVSSKTYHIEGDVDGRRIRTAFVNLGRNLRAERTAIVEDLTKAIGMS